MCHILCFRSIQLCAVIVLSCVVVCWAGDNRSIDDFPYKNHRVSKNESQLPLNKYPAYPSQVYADLSNLKDYSTETPTDTVRVYITPSSLSKRKLKTNLTVPPVQVQSSTNSPVFKSSSPDMYYVTGVNSAHTSSKTPVYSPSYPIKETMSFQTPQVTEDESKRQLRSNGTKNRNVQKTPNQAQTHLLYATTQSPQIVHSKDPTTFAIPTKGNLHNTSKPFATVLVPKQMLEGDVVQHEYLREDSSFRPIAPPVFSYKQNSESNTVDNKKATNAAKAENTQRPYKQGNVKTPASYKVEENLSTEQLPYTADKRYSTEIKQNKFGLTNIQSEKPTIEKANDQIKRQGIPGYEFSKQDTRYGADSFKNEKQHLMNTPYPTDKYREFYPATEDAPSKEMYSQYNPAGKFEMVKPPMSFEYEKSAKPLSNPSSWFAPTNSETEFKGPESSVGDVYAKDVLKSLLQDMIKSKQQSEIKPKTAGMNEFIDSYFKTSRPNVDFSLENVYDIETGKPIIHDR